MSHLAGHSDTLGETIRVDSCFPYHSADGIIVPQSIFQWLNYETCSTLATSVTFATMVECVRFTAGTKESEIMLANNSIQRMKMCEPHVAQTDQHIRVQDDIRAADQRHCGFSCPQALARQVQSH